MEQENVREDWWIRVDIKLQYLGYAGKPRIE